MRRSPRGCAAALAVFFLGCASEDLVDQPDELDDPDTTTLDAVSTVLFNSNFQPGTVGYPSGAQQITDIRGTDLSVPAPNNWTNFNPRLGGGDFKEIDYQGAPASAAYARIIADPTATGRGNVLKYWMKYAVSHATSGGTKGRIEAQFGPTAGDTLYVKYMLYIHGDIKRLEANTAAVSFLNIAEYWPGGGNNNGNQYPFRIGMRLNKDRGAGMPLHFGCDATKATPGVVGWTDVWARDNKSFRLPYDKWATVEVFLKKGNASTGRFSVYVTPAGGTKTTVCDARTWTYHPNNPSPDGGAVKFFQPFKLYASDDVINAIRGPNNDHAAIFYFDNLSIREGFPY